MNHRTNPRLWLTGRQFHDDTPWEVLGIYTDREVAVARCRRTSDFVWELRADEDFPEETATMSVEWPLKEAGVA